MVTIQTNNMDGIMTKETLENGKLTKQVIVDGKVIEETIIDEQDLVREAGTKSQEVEEVVANMLPDQETTKTPSVPHDKLAGEEETKKNQDENEKTTAKAAEDETTKDEL
jgi:hypothetical protein